MKRIILVLLLVAGGACGDDDGGDVAREQPGTTERTEVTAEAAAPAGARVPVDLDGPVNQHATVRYTGDPLGMELDSFYFDPTFVEVEPRAAVSLALRNESDVEHTFTVDALDVDEVVGPGEEATVEVVLRDNDPVEVEYVCRFHAAQGMRGAFFSTEG